MTDNEPKQRRKEKDYFLINPPQQPKKEIIEYITGDDGNIINTFEEMLEYLKSEKSVIVRSEHPNEYSEASGLLKSFEFTKKSLRKIENIPEKELWEQFKKESRKDVKYYCKLTGQNFEVFYGKISYSYWKKIDGINRSIVADSAIVGRYHIFTGQNGLNPPALIIKNDDTVIVENTGSFPPYLTVQDGEIILNDQNIKYYKEIDIEKIMQFLIFYEKIRNLEKFDPNHCPIIEFQTDNNGNNHPLQLHRSRDMEKAQFTLNRKLESDEFEASFVRGTTPSEGKIYNVTINHQAGSIAYIEHLKENVNNLKRILVGMNPLETTRIIKKVEESIIRPEYISKQSTGSVIDGQTRSSVFETVMNQRNKLSIIPMDSNTFMNSIGNSHISKSTIVSPELTINIPPNHLKYNDNISGIKIRVTSDGRKAYYTFL